MVMFQEDKQSRLGINYTSSSYEALLKNPPLQTKVWLEISGFFLGTCQCDPWNKVQHFKNTNMWLDLNKALHYTVVRKSLHVILLCSVIPHSCLKKPLCCCHIVCVDIKTRGEKSNNKNQSSFTYKDHQCFGAQNLGSKERKVL